MSEHDDTRLIISEIALKQLKAKVIKFISDYNRGGVSEDDFYFTIGEFGKDIADIYAYRNSSMDSVKVMEGMEKLKTFILEGNHAKSRRKKKMVTARCIIVNAIDGTIKEVTHEITEEQMEKVVSILDEVCGENKKDKE